MPTDRQHYVQVWQTLHTIQSKGPETAHANLTNQLRLAFADPVRQREATLLAQVVSCWARDSVQTWQDICAFVLVGRMQQAPGNDHAGTPFSGNVKIRRA